MKKQPATNTAQISVTNMRDYRQLAIATALKEGDVDVAQLARDYAVSPSTIQKDIQLVLRRSLMATLPDLEDARLLLLKRYEEQYAELAKELKGLRQIQGIQSAAVVNIVSAMQRITTEQAKLSGLYDTKIKVEHKFEAYQMPADQAAQMLAFMQEHNLLPQASNMVEAEFEELDTSETNPETIPVTNDEQTKSTAVATGN